VIVKKDAEVLIGSVYFCHIRLDVLLRELSNDCGQLLKHYFFSAHTEYG